jgi:hypothetical protein
VSTFCATKAFQKNKKKVKKKLKKKIAGTAKKKKLAGKDFFCKRHAGKDFFYFLTRTVLSTTYTGPNNTTNRQIRLLGKVLSNTAGTWVRDLRHYVRAELGDALCNLVVLPTP